MQQNIKFEGKDLIVNYEIHKSNSKGYSGSITSIKDKSGIDVMSKFSIKQKENIFSLVNEY